MQLFNDKKWENVEKRGYIVGIYELQQYYSYFYVYYIYRYILKGKDIGFGLFSFFVFLNYTCWIFYTTSQYIVFGPYYVFVWYNVYFCVVHHGFGWSTVEHSLTHNNFLHENVIMSSDQ